MRRLLVKRREPEKTVSSEELAALRAQILELVEKFQTLRSPPEAFVPGETMLRYAGRVFGPEEVRNVVDAGLDFWLTAGRFTEQFEAGLADVLGVSDVAMVNSGSSANLVALSTLTSPKLGSRRLRP